MKKENLILYDEDGNILEEDYSNDEDKGIDAYDTNGLTKEDVEKEGTLIDKLIYTFKKK